MNLEELEVYNIALKISDLSWEIYLNLPKEFRYSINQQFLNASDSVGANIAEGFGRYHFRDSLKFYYNARGSLYESEYWINRLKSRNLISFEMFNKYSSLIEIEKPKLNSFINNIRSKL
jgi:four helix bundle protein